MRINKLYCRLSAAALFLLSAVSATEVSAVSLNEISIRRTYSETTVSVPKLCEISEFRHLCSQLVNGYAGRFEREMVVYRSSFLDTEDESLSSLPSLSSERLLGRQHVKISIYSSAEESSVFSVFTVLNRELPPDGRHSVLVEVTNYDKESRGELSFRELFKKPSLAAMICARAIEKNYKAKASPLLAAVISATELEPSNYLITPTGLRFFFAPGLVNNKGTDAESMLIPIEALKKAQPDMSRWSTESENISEEQKAALAASGLGSVIRLDHRDQEINISKEAAEQIRADRKKAADNAALSVKEKKPAAAKETE